MCDIPPNPIYRGFLFWQLLVVVGVVVAFFLQSQLHQRANERTNKGSLPYLRNKVIRCYDRTQVKISGRV